MSDTAPAPAAVSQMSFWEILYKARIWLVGLLIIVVFLIFPVEIDPDFQYPFYTLIAVAFVTYLLTGYKVGFAIDTSKMADGVIELKEINKQELDTLTSKCMVMSSALGPVVVTGHLLQTEDKLHSLLEVQTNTALANRCAEWVNKSAPRLLEFERTIDLATTVKVRNEVKEWQKLMRVDPELTNLEQSLEKSPDSSAQPE